MENKNSFPLSRDAAQKVGDGSHKILAENEKRKEDQCLKERQEKWDEEAASVNVVHQTETGCKTEEAKPIEKTPHEILTEKISLYLNAQEQQALFRVIDQSKTLKNKTNLSVEKRKEIAARERFEVKLKFKLDEASYEEVLKALEKEAAEKNKPINWSFELYYLESLEKEDEIYRPHEKKYSRPFCSIDYGLPPEETIAMIDAIPNNKDLYQKCLLRACEKMRLDLLKALLKKTSKTEASALSELIPQFVKNVNIKHQLDDLSEIDLNDVKVLTPFHFALVEGDVNKLKVLVGILGKDALLNFCSSSGTFLHFAALACNLDIIKYLVEQGLSGFDKRSDWKDSPFELAAGQGRLDVVRYLYETANPPCNKEFLTKVSLQVLGRGDKKRTENAHVLQFLLEKGVDPRAMLKRIDFSDQIYQLNHSTLRGYNCEQKKAYKEKQIKFIHQRQSILYKYYVSSVLKPFFIKKYIEKEKNAVSQKNSGVYETVLDLLEWIANEGVFDFNGEKEVSRDILNFIRSHDVSEWTAEDFCVFIKKTIHEYSISHCKSESFLGFRSANKIAKSFEKLQGVEAYLYLLKEKEHRKKEKHPQPEAVKASPAFISPPASSQVCFSATQQRVIKNIEVYLKENKFDSWVTSSKTFFFDHDQGQTRAIVYKKLLERAKSEAELDLILDALLISSKGDTLKKYVIENRFFAWAGFQSPEIKFLKKNFAQVCPQLNELDPEHPEKLSFAQKDIIALQQALKEKIKSYEKKDCTTKDQAFYYSYEMLNNLKFLDQKINALLLRKKNSFHTEADAQHLANLVEEGYIPESPQMKEALIKPRYCSHPVMKTS